MSTDRDPYRVRTHSDHYVPGGELWGLLIFAACMSCFLMPVWFTDDGDTIINRHGELAPAGRFPASTIAANSLAPDSCGMSPNDQDAADVQLLYAGDVPGSDGDSSGASNDALLVFRTQRDGSHKLMLSHFDGSSFTPPTRLYAPDMDPSQPIHVPGAPDSARDESAPRPR